MDILKHAGHEVRSVVIDGEVYFVAKDVFEALEITRLIAPDAVNGCAEFHDFFLQGFDGVHVSRACGVVKVDVKLWQDIGSSANTAAGAE